jgi:hypothetical protein
MLVKFEAEGSVNREHIATLACETVPRNDEKVVINGVTWYVKGVHHHFTQPEGKDSPFWTHEITVILY